MSDFDFSIFRLRLHFNDGTFVHVNDATIEQIVKWINEAPSPENRSIRKQEIHYALYGSYGSLRLTKDDPPK